MVRKAWGRSVGPCSNVRIDLQAACAAAGVPRVSPNDLRRTCASWMVQGGVSNPKVAAWLGHTSTQMVDKVYGHLDLESLREAAGAVPKVAGARKLRSVS
ncbi:MAG: tyrosine-type recombinase/integrase [Deltaproteobacteria bacterium]|nr:tyrosine-type recombinase/integrase [Deltaproteobacteria bacterium]